jgi:hypothetical protein
VVERVNDIASDVGNKLKISIEFQAYRKQLSVYGTITVDIFRENT